MATKIWLSKFDPSNNFVALRRLDVAHEDPAKREIMPGARIDKSIFTTRQLRLMYEQRRIGIAGSVEKQPPVPVSPVKTAEATKGNGRAVLSALPATDEADYEVVKRKGQWYVIKGDVTVFGPGTETQAKGQLKEILDDQAA